MKQIELTVLLDKEEAVITCRHRPGLLSDDETKKQAEDLANFLFRSIPSATFDELCRLLQPDSTLRHGAKWHGK